jgi:hypothetical protein
LSREAFQAKAYIRRTLQNVGKKLSPKMNIGYPVRFCLRAYPTTSEPMALNAGILSFGKSTLGKALSKDGLAQAKRSSKTAKQNGSEPA